ncbi:MAG: dihydroorotase [Candidatus Omnitrophota bacterium]
MNLLIRNGRLIDPGSSTDRVCSILIQDGIIKEISESIPDSAVPSGSILDASGWVVAPGFIDLHVHLREPGQEHKETIETGCKAAARGGFTSIACMPNTSPVNDSIDVTQTIIRKAKEVGRVNVFPIAAVSMNLESNRLTDMDALVKAGAVGFSDDGRCVMDERLFTQALERARILRVPIIEHPEDHGISKDGQVNEGAISQLLGLNGISSASEDVIIERDIRIQEKMQSFLHLTHISTRKAVDMIRDAKKRHIAVTADVTPHHLLLDETVLDPRNRMSVNPTFYKMKPPLRTAQDRQALIDGLKDGTIDCIATDHAPHSREEKEQAFEKAPFGITGLETAFSLLFDRLVRTNIIDWNHLIRLLSTHPAQILHLTDRGGGRPGLPADLTIIDPEHPFKINEDDFQSKASNSPFIGWEGKGVIACTIVNGKIVYQY